MIKDPSQLTRDLSKHCNDKIKRALMQTVDLLDEPTQAVWLAVCALDLIFDFTCAAVMNAYEHDTGKTAPSQDRIAAAMIARLAEDRLKKEESHASD